LKIQKLKINLQDFKTNKLTKTVIIDSFEFKVPTNICEIKKLI